MKHIVFSIAQLIAYTVVLDSNGKTECNIKDDVSKLSVELKTKHQTIMLHYNEGAKQPFEAVITENDEKYYRNGVTPLELMNEVMVLIVRY